MPGACQQRNQDATHLKNVNVPFREPGVAAGNMANGLIFQLMTGAYAQPRGCADLTADEGGGRSGMLAGKRAWPEAVSVVK